MLVRKGETLWPMFCLERKILEDDQDAGAPEFKALRAKGENHPIEKVGRELRSMMSWVKAKDDYREGSAARE